MKELIRKSKTPCLVMMIFLLLAPFLSGCITMPPPEPPTVDREIATPVTPRPVRAPLSELRPLGDIKPLAAVEQAMPFDDKLFSISVLDAQLQEAIMPIASAADLNLVFDQGVDISARVSAHFTDLSLRQALDLILSSLGYYHQINGNILRIKAMETRFYTLDYSLLASSPSSSVGGDQFSVDSSGEEDDVKVWQVLEKALGVGASGGGGGGESLLSEQGTAQINKMAGMIIVTDRPENLDKVAHYLKNLEKALVRQVLIEAKIVEVTLRSGHQYGIDWRMVHDRVSRGGMDYEIGSFMAPAANTFSLVWGGGSLSNPIDITLNALASEGNVNVLSSPRLNVLNNQSGMINFQTSIPYFQWEVRNVGTADNPRYEPVPTVVFAEEGVTLGITPQISGDGYINLSIVPVVSKRTDTAVLNYQGSNFQIPIMSVRETSTMIRVQDGGTVVLGGIIEESSEDLRNKIPLLGDIPGLGRLFSSQERSTRKTELVVMVTATILEN